MNTNTKKKLILSISIIVLVIFITLYVCLNIDINQLLSQIKELPITLKALAMIGLIAIQIVLAFIPGEPFELASGYIFGDLFGTIICLIGSCIGTAIIYGLVHSYRYKIINIFFDQNKVDEVESLLSSSKSKFFIFLIFLIPGTPKDAISYIACLSDVKIPFWLAFTSTGRIPSIITSTYLSHSLKQGNYMLAIIIFVVTIALVICGSILYKRYVDKQNQKTLKIKE